MKNEDTILNTAFKAVHNFTQKHQMLCTMLDAYLAAFGESEHGQDWDFRSTEYSEEGVYESIYFSLLSAKESYIGDVKYYSITIREDGKVELCAHCDQSNQDVTFEKNLDISALPINVAIGKILTALKVLKYDGCFGPMEGFNAQQMKARGLLEHYQS